MDPEFDREMANTRKVLIVAAGILMFTMAPSALAQTASQGTLTGLVTDQQGATIPGAAVKITDATTNSSRETLTNETGRYTIPNIQPGTYIVTVTKQGFTTAKLTGQVIEVGQALTLDVPMAVGSTTTTVEVQATAGAELQTLNATVGSTISIITKHELVLAIIGGLFVLEAVSVIVQVASFKMTGRRVFRMAPLHHHFEQKGWEEPTIVIRFWIIASILAIAGLATLKLR